MRRLAIAASLAALVCAIPAASGAMAPSFLEPHSLGKRCPKGEPDALRVARLDERRVRVARRMARRHRCEFRVVKRNGEFLPITSDLRRDRVNVHVRNGQVTRVSGVY